MSWAAVHSAPSSGAYCISQGSGQRAIPPCPPKARPSLGALHRHVALCLWRFAPGWGLRVLHLLTNAHLGKEAHSRLVRRLRVSDYEYS